PRVRWHVPHLHAYLDHMAARLDGLVWSRSGNRRRRLLARGNPPMLLLLAPLLVGPPPRGVLSDALLFKPPALCLELGLAQGSIRLLLLSALGLVGLGLGHALGGLRLHLSLVAPCVAREYVTPVGPAHDHQHGRTEEGPVSRCGPRRALRVRASVEDNSG